MALSIVPVLLSLLPSAVATDLLVRVVDKDGKPVAGVQVALLGQPVFEGFTPPAHMHGAATSDEQGIARFVDAEKSVTPAERMKYLVRLGVPTAQDVVAEIDPRKLAESAPTLTLPDCGSVILRLPIEGKARANLRRAPDDTDPLAGFGHGDELPTVKVAGGLARFERVGLGIELEYEVESRELPALLTGKFRGPKTKGEVVEFRVPGLEALPGVLVTLVDENLAPIHGVEISYNISVSTKNSSSSRGGSVKPDEKGRARIPLVREQARPGVRLLSIYVPSSGDRKGYSYESPVELDLPDDFASGELDLGRVLLAPAGSPKRFLLDDDAALERRYEELLAKVRKDSTSRRESFELLLLEMVRRGGARWEAYVAAKLKETRDPANEELRWRGPGELEVLTALRRLQGKPDPLALVIQTESVLEATFPDTPTVVFAMKNVDTESFGVTDGGSYRSGRFARCNVLAVAPDGSTLPPREWGGGMAGGMSSTRTLAPGESMDGALPLGDYVALAQPGAYRVRLRYHDEDDIDSLADLRGRLFTSSEEFRAQIRPRRIELTQTRLDELRGWIQAIDAKKAIPLVSGHWHAGMTFTGAAKDPEDKLFRAGFEAVPALYAAMQDKATGPEHRAWVFGMLWNILGIENPGDHNHRAALGNIKWIGTWPTSTEEARQNFGEFGESSPMSIDSEAQDALADAWMSRKGLIEVKIVP